jgi:hypothetical protein
MGAYRTHSARWLLVVAVLTLSAEVSRAPSAERGRGVATQAGAGTPRSDKIRNRAVVRSAIDRAYKTNWAARFRTLGTNYFEFIAQAAPAAYQGDSAAQYYIGRALDRCEETNALYQNADDPDQAVAHLAMVPALREHDRQELLDCRQLLTGTAFKTLPARSGGYPAEYWKSRAVDSRYPAALVAATVESPAPSSVQTLAEALAAGDEEAMLLFGWTRVNAANADEPAAVLGAAWVLAACNSNAASCESAGDLFPITYCETDIEFGCREHFSGIDELSARLSAQDLKRARQLATEIQTDLGSHEPPRLIKYLAL